MQATGRRAERATPPDPPSVPEAPPAGAASNEPAGRQRGSGWWPYLLIAPTVLGTAALLLVPLLRGVLISFQDFELRQLINGDAEFVGFDNYATLLGDSRFWEVVRRTFLFMAINVVAIMVLSTLVALLVERLGRFGRTMVLSGLVLAWGMPVIAATTVFQWMFHSEYGVVNWSLTSLGFESFDRYPWFANGPAAFAIVVFLVVWQSIPFAAITLYAGLTTVPRELHEAARLDGASAWQAFRTITYPMLRPIFLLVLCLEVIWTFRAFVQIWVITQGGPGDATTILPVYAVQTALSAQRYDLGSAASMITVLLMSTVLVIYFRQLYRQEAEQ
ncbi:ABC transporter permease subunit [Streptomyces sp. 3MP-14]|uniref:ABC transporter permease subunit n=1 Tax=Streptomyces mimosae TaxID=2586635 RepID=A0A5N6AAB9_9ACTN|nr:MULTISPECIES: sugar ABC transporter permease [Streptomyces]KAB8165767.1 ABC transporter permease subunit [Streptomyces mimosae]KAB8176156.1 ABC transporter permease subunit [Streptomyces sp. 3MP-14]